MKRGMAYGHYILSLNAPSSEPWQAVNRSICDCRPSVELRRELEWHCFNSIIVNLNDRIIADVDVAQIVERTLAFG